MLSGLRALPMTFRIERLVSGENAIVLRVCGRVQIERVNTIKELIEEETAKLALAIARDHLKRETHTKGRTPVTDTYKALPGPAVRLPACCLRRMRPATM